MRNSSSIGVYYLPEVELIDILFLGAEWTFPGIFDDHVSITFLLVVKIMYWRLESAWMCGHRVKSDVKGMRCLTFLKRIYLLFSSSPPPCPLKCKHIQNLFSSSSVSPHSLIRFFLWRRSDGGCV